MGLNPIKEMSSSEIRRNIFRIISGVNFIVTVLDSASPSAIEFHEAHRVAIPSNLILSGCLQPQPSSVFSPQRLISLDVIVET